MEVQGDETLVRRSLRRPSADVQEADSIHNDDTSSTTSSDMDPISAEDWHTRVSLFVKKHCGRLDVNHDRIRTVDKIAFVGGVLNVILWTLAMFSSDVRPFLPYWYSLNYACLLPFRFFNYKLHKWHFFMLDFCYLGSTLVMMYLWVFPDSPQFFQLIYGITHGPICWATITFGNALVFHDVDQITSLFIHLSPSLLLYTLRWNPAESSLWWHETFQVFPESSTSDMEMTSTSDTGKWLLINPFYTFLLHMFAYYVIVQIFFFEKLRRDKNIITMYRWITLTKSGAVWDAINYFGSQNRLATFGFLNGIYCLLTLIPVYFWYHSKVANLIFVTFVSMVATWNGANFYIEVFARSYEGHPSVHKVQ